MDYLKQLNNIYVIDTKMWGFSNYSAAYVVKGKELALIDTGEPNQFEALRNGLKEHGFSISDISYVFVTHTEHMDHAGNVAPLLKENSKAFVYINPIGEKFLTEPQNTRWRDRVSNQLLTKRIKRGKMEPVPVSRIKHVKDGDVFDLGDGEKLKVIYAPGHQPSGIVLAEEKNNGLFINDLPGNYFFDVGSQYQLNPFNSDPLQIVESLKKLVDLPVSYLFLGHYGICDKPREIISRAIDKYQQIIDIGIKCIREGKPDLIAEEVYQTMSPELEKLRYLKDKSIYEYVTQDHVPFQCELFARYCLEKFGK